MSLGKLIIGTSNLGKVFWTPKEQFRFLDSLVENDFKSFDLAASYQLGGTERLFGAWTQERKNRDQLYLISKGGHPYPLLKPNRLTKWALEADLNSSLKRLKTDYLDLYMLHRDHPYARLTEIADFVERAKKSGKIKAFGLSNWHHGRIQALGLPIEASSPHFSLASWGEAPWPDCVSIAGKSNQKARDFYTRQKIPVLAWSPLGNGYFSDKNPKTYKNFPNASRRQRAKKLAVQLGVTAPQIALAYLFNQPFKVHPIIGSSNLEHIKAASEASNITLTPSQVVWLESGS